MSYKDDLPHYYQVSDNFILDPDYFDLFVESLKNEPKELRGVHTFNLILRFLRLNNAKFAMKVYDRMYKYLDLTQLKEIKKRIGILSQYVELNNIESLRQLNRNIDEFSVRQSMDKEGHISNKQFQSLQNTKKELLTGETYYHMFAQTLDKHILRAENAEKWKTRFRKAREFFRKGLKRPKHK